MRSLRYKFIMEGGIMLRRIVLIIILLMGIAGTAIGEPLDNWHLISPPPTERSLSGITYGNNIFVAVGWSGTILTSTDGINWTKRESGTLNPLNRITYADGKFIAVGWGGTILTSTDGIAWTSRASGNTSSLNGIAYGNSAFVAVGDSGIILTSADGITWTARASGITS